MLPWRTSPAYSNGRQRSSIMKISEIMTTDVKVIDPEQSLQQAAIAMRENDKLIGMVTDRDITVRGAPSSSRYGPMERERSCRPDQSRDDRCCRRRTECRANCDSTPRPRGGAGGSLGHPSGPRQRQHIEPPPKLRDQTEDQTATREESRTPPIGIPAPDKAVERSATRRKFMRTFQTR